MITCLDDKKYNFIIIDDCFSFVDGQEVGKFGKDFGLGGRR